MSEKILQNCTPKRLSIHGRDDAVLILSPLERSRQLGPEELAPFAVERLERRNIVALSKPAGGERAEVLLRLFVWAVILYVVAGATFAEALPYYWFWAGAILLAALVLGLLIASRGAAGVGQSAVQFVTLLLAVGLAVGLPAAVIYQFGEGHRLLAGERSLLALGRGLQFLLIAIAALLPALLYYLFDRQQLATLRERFEQEIFRFDPDVETLSDVRARYGRQLEETYGRDDAALQGRLSRAKRWPILMATLVITLGWIVALAPVHPTGAPPVLNDLGALLGLLVPQAHPVVFGFLGAYFFALYTVLHRYVRRDLMPSAYSSITVRILAVVILAWILSELFGSDAARALAFLFGIMPETGVAFIQDVIRSRSGKLGRRLPEVYTEEHPLTELEGIGLYDRARLADEGVINVQSLAHHDLIDLMIETRIPIPRLIDWVDQAILYLHLRRIEKAGVSGFPWRERFHQLGIRRATDLLCLYDAARRSDPPPDFPVEVLLAPPPGETVDPKRVEQLHALVHCVEQNEWIENIRYWRTRRPVEEMEIKAEAPAPEAEEPAVKAEEPAVKAEEPAVKAEEPAAKAEEPAVKAKVPTAKAKAPTAEPAVPAPAGSAPNVPAGG